MILDATLLCKTYPFHNGSVIIFDFLVIAKPNVNFTLICCDALLPISLNGLLKYLNAISHKMEHNFDLNNCIISLLQTIHY